MTNLLRIAVSGALLTWIGLKMDWDKVGQAFAHLQAGYWFAALGLLIATQIVSAVRWGLYARALGFDAPTTRLSGYYFIGMYFNLLLPTSVGGDVVRIWYLNREQGRKFAAAAAVLLDRLNGLMVLVALACTAVVLSPLELPSWVPISVAGIVGAGVCGVLGLALLHTLGKLTGPRAEQLATVLTLLCKPMLTLQATLLSLFVQLANVVLVWFLAQGLGIEIALPYLAIAVPMVSLLTLLPISLNGMGVREWGTTLFLTPLGVPGDSAVILAFLWFAVYLTVSVLGGLVYLFGHFPKPESPAGSSGAEVEDGSVDRDSHQGRERQSRSAA